MVTLFSPKTAVLLAMAVLAVTLLLGPAAFAADEAGAAAPASQSTGHGLGVLGLGIGAGIAFAGGALGTGRAQGQVGAGGTGALAEKPDLFGNILILFAIPESMLVFGFVMAFLLWLKI